MRAPPFHLTDVKEQSVFVQILSCLRELVQEDKDFVLVGDLACKLRDACLGFVFECGWDIWFR